jgi:hypothetical protein
MSEAIRRTGAQRGGRSRRPLWACWLQRQRIGYFALKKEDKATVLGPRFETCAHCFSGNSCDIIGLQAPRRSQNVDREIRTLWRAPARVPIGQARAAESDVRNFKRRRPVQFLAPGRCYRFHEGRVLFSGSVVFHPGVCQPQPVGLDKQRAAISAQAICSSVNLTRPANILSTFGPYASLSCFVIHLINAADIGADQILAGMRA